MKPEFEKHINQIITILNKRIITIHVITLILLVTSIILLILFPNNLHFGIITFILSILTFSLYFLFRYHKKKLIEILTTYRNNPQYAYDILSIIVNQYNVSMHNYVIRLYFKKLINYHNKALTILKNDLYK